MRFINSISILIFLLAFSIQYITAKNGIIPKLVEFLARRSQNMNTKLKILCQPQEGSKPFRFEWHKNGIPLSPEKEIRNFSYPLASVYRIETTEEDSLLVIDNLSIYDSANYTCVVRNHYGSNIQFTVLTVKGLIFIDIYHVLHKLKFFLKEWRKLLNFLFWLFIIIIIIYIKSLQFYFRFHKLYTTAHFVSFLFNSSICCRFIHSCFMFICGYYC